MNNTIINITMPVFNRYELTQLSIISLNKMNRNIPFSITVVDNGSEKQLQDRLIRFKEDDLIQNLFILEKNYGVSCACNIGFKSVDAQFYLKCDNDIVIKDVNFISKLLYMYQQVNYMSTLGPALINDWIVNNPEIVCTKYGKLARCKSNLPGGALLIPKAIINILGYFSEDYNLYGADDGDYGLRMNMAGFNQYYYEYESFFDHRGQYDNSEYNTSDLDKSKEHRELFRTSDNKIGLFSLNEILYSTLSRNWKVPPRYEIVDQNGYYLKLREREEYPKIRQALIRSQEIITHYTDYKKIHNTRYDINFPTAVVEKLKKIWAKCGQECVIENLIK